MTAESDFRALMQRARDTSPPDYRAGYERGLRQRYHGAAFGTPEEHAQWLALADSEETHRAERGRGYQDGWAGRPPAAACSVDGCARFAGPARGLCSTHYQRQRRTGDTGGPEVQRRGLESLALRVGPEVLAALDTEAERTGESRYRVAQRWLEERAARVRP